MLIRLRIKVFIINSVYNTPQRVCPGIEQTVQPFAVEICLDFLRICIGNCRDGICIHKTALEQIGILVSLQFIRRKEIIGKTGDILDILHIPFALEFQVMDCHDSLDAPEKLPACKTLL